MKSALALVLGCVVATATGTVVAQSAAEGAAAAATEPIAVSASSNASNTTSGHGMSPQALILKCVQPNGGANPFWRLTKADGPHTCHVPPLQSEWAMLRSYRDGGIQNVHWKYTDNENDQECLKDWTYHAADGRTVKAKISGRTTTFGLGRRWCGLPVYNDGGVQGYQWDYCKCFFVDDGGGDIPI